MKLCFVNIYLWNGEYDGNCILPEGHDGYHWDEVSHWSTNNNGEFIQFEELEEEDEDG